MTDRNAQLEIRSEGVQRFVEAAERYCIVIDELQSFSKVSFLDRMDELLPLLYWSVHGLPDLNSKDWEEPEQEDEGAGQAAIKAHSREHSRLMRQLQDKLGEHHLYHFVFDPTSPDDHEDIPGTLGDDLADIYLDLKEQLDLYKQGAESDIKEAIWEWRFGFMVHWGHHCTAALRVIHSLHRNYLLEEE